MEIAVWITAVWITSGLLALFYVVSGGMKAFRSVDALRPQMEWVDDFHPGTVKAIGIVEIVGAVGVIVPHLTGILPWLSVVAAFALVGVQIVATIVHLRRKDYAIGINIVLFVLALFVGIGLLVVL